MTIEYIKRMSFTCKDIMSYVITSTKNNKARQ